MIETGEKTNYKSSLICRNCGQKIDIGANDTVPPCPRCGNTTFDE